MGTNRYWHVNEFSSRIQNFILKMIFFISNSPETLVGRMFVCLFMFTCICFQSIIGFIKIMKTSSVLCIVYSIFRNNIIGFSGSILGYNFILVNQQNKHKDYSWAVYIHWILRKVMYCDLHRFKCCLCFRKHRKNLTYFGYRMLLT